VHDLMDVVDRLRRVRLSVAFPAFEHFTIGVVDLLRRELGQPDSADMRFDPDQEIAVAVNRRGRAQLERFEPTNLCERRPLCRIPDTLVFGIELDRRAESLCVLLAVETLISFLALSVVAELRPHDPPGRVSVPDSFVHACHR